MLAVGALLFIAFSIAAALRRPAWAWGSVALLLAALDAAHVRLVPPTAYRVDRTALRLAIIVRQPMNVGYVQIGQPWEPLFNPPLWPRFDVETDGEAGQAEHLMAARDVTPISCKDDIRSITITTSSTINLAAESIARLNLYRSRSLIWRFFGWLHDHC